MLKISDFAEIAQISTSALRYYDEHGLFKPAHVDQATGYRYYTIGQLIELNRILALKDLGLDLTQIAKLIQEELSPEAFQGMLRFRQAQLQQQIRGAREQLARIEGRINYIEQGGTDVPEVVLKSVNLVAVASQMTGQAGFIPNLTYARQFLDLLRERRVRPNGYMQYLYHRDDRAETGFNVEFAVPIDDASAGRLRATSGSTFNIRELPAVSYMATAVHRGSPYSITEAYQAVGDWLQRHAYTIIGPCRKVCLQWDGDLQDYLTEIQFPVALGNSAS